MDFVVPANQRMNIKENEKRDKYLELSRELKKLWNMKVTVTPNLIAAVWKSEDDLHLTNNKIVLISHNISKSPGVQ